MQVDNTTPSGELQDLQVGKPFDPQFRVCGFDPTQFILKDTTILRVRKSDGKQLPLTQSQKLLYERIIAWCGKNRCCWHGSANMARLLGRSIRAVKGDVAALIEVGLMCSQRQGPHYAIYRPLYHPVFDRAREKEVQPAALQSDEKKCNRTSKEVHPEVNLETAKSGLSGPKTISSGRRKNAEYLRRDKRASERAEIRLWLNENLVWDDEYGGTDPTSTEVYRRWVRSRSSGRDGLLYIFKGPPLTGPSVFGRILHQQFPAMQSILSTTAETRRLGPVRVYTGLRFIESEPDYRPSSHRQLSPCGLKESLSQHE